MNGVESIARQLIRHGVRVIFGVGEPRGRARDRDDDGVPTRWGLRVVTMLLLLGLFAVVAVVGILFVWSFPGQPPPYVDASGAQLPGSISEKTFVPINGLRQGMFIRGHDTSRPVLLYVHGGMPEYFLERRHPSKLDELFTVVWWEQRGAGLSWSTGVPKESISAEQLISDTIELSRVLRQRFGQEKIYLMGHSGGTFVAIQAAARAPELFHAYIGVAQMVQQLESERIAHAWMVQEYGRLGDSAMVSRLEGVPITTGTPDAYLRVRDVAMHRLGVGTMRDMRSVFTGIVVQSLRCPDYTLGEKIRTWRGKAATGVSSMWGEMLATDLNERVPRLSIPAYFLHGRHDLTCAHTLARDYAARLEAPVKGFYTFEHAAHSPIFEDPARVKKILESDVLSGTDDLADR